MELIGHTATSGTDRLHAAWRLLLPVWPAAAAAALVWLVLDSPPTYSCSGSTGIPAPNFDERRTEFLAVALPITIALGAWLGTWAWRVASARMAGKGGARRPGRVALSVGLAVLIFSIAMLVSAFSLERVGGALFWSAALLGLPAAVLIPVLALAGLIHIAFAGGDQERWGRVAENFIVGVAWSILLFALPFHLVLVASVGKDATLWC